MATRDGAIGSDGGASMCGADGPSGGGSEACAPAARTPAALATSDEIGISVELGAAVSGAGSPELRAGGCDLDVGDASERCEPLGESGTAKTHEARGGGASS